MADETTEGKNPVGRPTKYRPEFCETILKVGEEGGWTAEMAEACDVVRSTFDLWVKEHPEFSEAFTRALQKSRVWFEKVGRNGLFADKFQANLWSKQMAARCPEDYSEKHRLDHTSSDGSMTPPSKLDVTLSPAEAYLQIKG